jgi:hypothetical protein
MQLAEPGWGVETLNYTIKTQPPLLGKLTPLHREHFNHQGLQESVAPATDAIPLKALHLIVSCVLYLSLQTCIKEIDLPAMSSKGA